MNGEREVVYWDTCIFLAHIKDEHRQNPQDMQGVEEMARAFDMGQIEIVTSTITITETLESAMTENARKEFEILQAKRNLHFVPNLRPIAEIAQIIRNYYHKENEPTVSTPDAIHLATAIWYGCNVFYTFDRKDTKKGLGLLTLEQPIAGQFDIPIQEPRPSPPDPQMHLWSEDDEPE